MPTEEVTRDMPGWLDGNEWAVWLGLALVLGVVEAATADLVFLMLAGGALAGSLAALLTLGVVGQVLVAVAVAVALLAVVRPLAKRRLTSTEPAAAIGTDRYLGAVGVVTATVTDTEGGLVRVHEDTWSAQVAGGEPAIPKGREARVCAIRGATLIVTAVPPVRDIITRGE